MQNTSLMDLIKIAGFLLSFGTFLLFGLTFYDRMKDNQTAVIAQLSGIREELGGVNGRLQRVEEAVFPILPRLSARTR